LGGVLLICWDFRGFWVAEAWLIDGDLW
jgi:hypothetical protein